MYYSICFLCILLCVNSAVSDDVNKTKEYEDFLREWEALFKSDTGENDKQTDKGNNSVIVQNDTTKNSTTLMDNSRIYFKDDDSNSVVKKDNIPSDLTDIDLSVFENLNPVKDVQMDKQPTNVTTTGINGNITNNGNTTNNSTTLVDNSWIYMSDNNTTENVTISNEFVDDRFASLQAIKRAYFKNAKRDVENVTGNDSRNANNKGSLSISSSQSLVLIVLSLLYTTLLNR